MSLLTTFIQQNLEKIKSRSLYRRRLIRESEVLPWIKIKDVKLVNFSHNDYLGLSCEPAVIYAMQHAIAKYGVGSGASKLVTGYTDLHAKFEEEIAEWLSMPRALLYSSGFLANIGVCRALLNRRDYIIQDKYNHASLIDAASMTGLKSLRYAHLNAKHCAERFKGLPASAGKILISDGVFSMDGDIAPLQKLSLIAKKNQAMLMIDDSHGLGVLGSKARGVVDLGYSPDILTASMGKAFGCSGGVILGSEDVIEACIQSSRTYTYSTALPPAIAAALSKSLELIKTQTWRHAKLLENIKLFRKVANEYRVPILDSNTAIQGVVVGDADQAMLLSNKLQQRGFLVVAMREPTVPIGTSRLRVVLSALHTQDMIVDLIQQINKLNIQAYTQ